MKKRFILIVRLLLAISLILPLSQVMAEDWIYTVRPGDNLWNLSERHLISNNFISRLQRLNSIRDPNVIVPGTKIRIPLAWTSFRFDDEHARIVGVRGKATLQRKGASETEPVKMGMQFFAGDMVKSEKDAYVTIEFADGSRMRIQNNTSVRLSSLEIFGDFGLVDILIELQYGRTESMVPIDSEADTRFRIKTPSAVSSVRGTNFRVGTVDRADTEGTSSEVLKGAVQVSGEGRAVEVPAGFGSVAKLGNTPLPPVALLAPPDLIVTAKLYERLPLEISLEPLTGADAYRAQIATDPEFQDLWKDFTAAKLPFRGGDLPDGDYWLRVRGIDHSGIEGHDAEMPFTLNAHPEVPFIVAPLPDAALDGQNPEFHWTAHTDAAHYIVEVSQEADFIHHLIFQPEVTNNYLKLTDPLDPGQYFWRIASVSASEGAGPFSDTMAFRVPFPGPFLEEPEIDQNEITFTWQAAVEGQSFHVQFARDDEFSDIIFEEQTANSKMTVPKPSGGSYYLRVKTIEPDGFEGPFGTTQKIDISHDTPYWLLILLLPLLILI